MGYKQDFTPDELYEVSQLNYLAGCFIRGGCIGMNDLKVVFKDGTVTVSGGKCILPDKRVLTVPEGGHVAATDFEGGYVYIRDGKIAAGDLPDGEGLFLLAMIQDGQVTDLRSRATIYAEEGVN